MIFAYSGLFLETPHLLDKFALVQGKKEKRNQVMDVLHCKDDYPVSWPIMTSPFWRSGLTLPPNQDDTLMNMSCVWFYYERLPGLLLLQFSR